MELFFADEIDFEVGNACDIILPKYVTKLTTEEISNILKLQDKHSRIIAAGTDPSDNKVTLLTANGKVMIFDARKFCVPDGPARPTTDGTQIFFPNENNRWPGPVEGFYADASWLIENSTSGLVGATLTTNNYRHEDKIK